MPWSKDFSGNTVYRTAVNRWKTPRTENSLQYRGKSKMWDRYRDAAQWSYRLHTKAEFRMVLYHHPKQGSEDVSRCQHIVTKNADTGVSAVSSTQQVTKRAFSGRMSQVTKPAVCCTISEVNDKSPFSLTSAKFRRDRSYGMMIREVLSTDRASYTRVYPKVSWLNYNEINNKNKHSLRSNTKGYSCKTH
jgi:hypothetical protein